MKLLLALTVALCAIGAAPIKAPAQSSLPSLNSYSAGYDRSARFQYNENDVKSFIYNWFAQFDHQQVPGYFLNRIAAPIDLEYPGTPIKSEQDFLKWYANVMETTVWNSHTLTSLNVTGDQEAGWTVNLTVHWKARDKDGKNSEALVNQTVNIVRIGDMLKVAKLRASLASK